MKQFLICLLMTSFAASLSFAGETTTECVMMRELNERNNPKANLSATKPKPKKQNTATAQ